MNETTGKSLARWWLLLGVAGLAVGGLLALPLAVAHTPAFATPAMQQLFHNALVVHVDLTVLVWFLTAACMVWSAEAAGRRAFITIPYLEQAALGAMGAGAALLAVSPLFGGEALMSNYIPVISNPVFFLGLALIFCSVVLQITYYFISYPLAKNLQGVACASTAIITGTAFVCFFVAAMHMPKVIEGEQYYDLLFWAGGHVLQNAYNILLVLTWLRLAICLRPGLKTGSWLGLLCFFLLLITVDALIVAVRDDVTSQNYRLFFTRDVMEVGGIAPALAGLWILTKLSLPSAKERAIFTSLAMSLLLFFYGGVLGVLIHGQDVTIPAHYHGSIVGVTLAFMGLAYLWLPRFGYGEVAHTKLAFWQPIIYGVGQIMHISGLAWSGGYGVLRKTPGALEGGFTSAKAAMGLMELGGLLAIIGGFMFVVVVGRAVYNSSSEPLAK